jgi:hypothetical protein
MSALRAFRFGVITLVFITPGFAPAHAQSLEEEAIVGDGDGGPIQLLTQEEPEPEPEGQPLQEIPETVVPGRTNVFPADPLDPATTLAPTRTETRNRSRVHESGRNAKILYAMH